MELRLLDVARLEMMFAVKLLKTRRPKMKPVRNKSLEAAPPGIAVQPCWETTPSSSFVIQGLLAN